MTYFKKKRSIKGLLKHWSVRIQRRRKIKENFTYQHRVLGGTCIWSAVTALSQLRLYAYSYFLYDNAYLPYAVPITSLYYLIRILFFIRILFICIRFICILFFVRILFFIRIHFFIRILLICILSIRILFLRIFFIPILFIRIIFIRIFFIRILFICILFIRQKQPPEMFYKKSYS